MDPEDADSGPPAVEWDQPLYVAHHRTDQKRTVTTTAIEHALNCNYDMLTCFITNDHFHTRVLAQLAAYDGDKAETGPVIPPLSDVDTDLSPGEVARRIIAFTSTWIDLCSQDPIISDISRQVLELEVAYAAFCGVEFLVIPGPIITGGAFSLGGLTPYARAIQEALSTGPHMNLLLQFPLTHDTGNGGDDKQLELGHLANHARSDSLESTDGTGVAKPALNHSPVHDTFGSWEHWHTVRSICNYSPRLLVALSIPSTRLLTAHHKTSLSRVEDRWYSEPIKALSFRPESFIESNKRGNPSLATDIQSLFSKLLRVKTGPWIILEDVEKLPPPEMIHFNDMGRIQIDGFRDKVHIPAGGPTPTEASSSREGIDQTQKWPFLHLEYFRTLQSRQPPKTVVERYGSGYQDYLQVPLQPLTDNLESMTYEVFEKDPVKYELYEEAVRKALRDWRDQKRSVSRQDGRITVAVAGAGRGPLVTRAIKASETEKIPIDIWAVEKNPNAYVHLQKNNAALWSGRVTIERSDMRSWKGPWRVESSSKHQKDSTSGTTTSAFDSDAKKQYYPVDILVSELLGSFGDNELSPECLDGVLHLLSPTGISIPQSYTAYLTPICAPKLHADLISRLAWESTAFETPAVVWLHAIDYLSTISQQKPAVGLPNVQEAWSFHHKPGNTGQIPKHNDHNRRSARVDFEIVNRAVCHGFGGYFESVLYPGVELSTHPNTMEDKSPAMISWFPIFFPLKTPVYVPDSSTLSFTMWRQSDNRKVWYEWLVESWTRFSRNEPDYLPARLGVSELHSSIKNGCLM